MLHPTNMSELSDVILVRDCSVEGPDGEVHPLKLSFYRPKPWADGSVKGTLRFECEYFDKMLAVFGADDLQVIGFLLSIGQVELELLAEKGFDVWWTEKGDRKFFDFWSYQEKPSEFSLPSAYHSAASEAFQLANEGRVLAPSHRVGIEPDRPAVTIYRVNDDGADSLGSVIGPEELKTHTWETLQAEVGKRILWDTRAGIEMMIALQPDRRAEDA